jgi:apolipoprotein N-acyltransferase
MQLLAQALLVASWMHTLANNKEEKRGWRGFFQGSSSTVLFVLSWLVGTIWWLYISMHFVGNLPAFLAAAAVLALAVFLSSYYILMLAIWKKIYAALGDFSKNSGSKAVFLSLSFACAWTIAEVLRGWAFTGFPWGAVGYAHYTGPLSVWAPILGVYGIGALASWVAALTGIALFFLLQLRPKYDTKNIRHAASGKWALLPLTMAFLVLTLSAFVPRFAFTKAKPAFDFALLQGNIGQAEKFNPALGVPQALNWYSERLQTEAASLIITPETALPVFFDDLPSGYWHEIEQALLKQKRVAIIGMPAGQAGSFTNSAVLLGHSEQAGQWRYDKHHLVPFGEFIPPLFAWFVRAVGIPLADFQAGARVQAPVRFAGNHLGINICYEDLFGEELARAFVSSEHPTPTVMVNMSNIAWFGPTTALPQHLAISRMRSLEFERPMLRATNTGATAVINHLGEVQAMLEFETQGVLHATVQGRSGVTPYAYWVGRWGLWPLVVVCLLGLLSPLLIGRRNAKKQVTPQQ